MIFKKSMSAYVKKNKLIDIGMEEAKLNGTILIFNKCLSVATSLKYYFLNLKSYFIFKFKFSTTIGVRKSYDC